MRLGLLGYPEKATHNSDTLAKSALMYLENHDHSRFICSFGTDSLYQNVFKEGKRENWFKLQPYAIALLFAKGIPMLWQGQEIVENYDVPDSGPARIGTLRPVRWEKFYTEEGQAMIRLYRKLIALRRSEILFRHGSYFFINDWNNHQSKGLLVFERKLENRMALVALNFSGDNHDIEYKFSMGGNYRERLHQNENFLNVLPGETKILSVPSNYGRVWVPD
jgi:1,4-alpha-glucan branching enzyme